MSKARLFCLTGMLSAIVLTVPGVRAQSQRDVFVLTSTNTTTNNVAVFRLDMSSAPTLSLVNTLPTGGAGGASGNAGALQFQDRFGAVVNYGSNDVTQLVRFDNNISVGATIKLSPGCLSPVSLAITGNLFVAGANCAESHDWPSGRIDGAVVALPDATAGQIAAGSTWAAVTLKSGSVLQLPLTSKGLLSGMSASVALPSTANNTPLGAAFWGNILGFNPAHSSDSFALVNSSGSVYPILGPQPAYPTNAPCWIAKGPGNVWYSGNSPGQAISIFFSDGQGGEFYKSIPVPGVPTDITVSADQKLLAVIYNAADGSGGRVAVYAIDAYGDLSLTATSSPIGVTAFNGVAISQ